MTMVSELRKRQDAIMRLQVKGQQIPEADIIQSATRANAQNILPRYSYEGSEKDFGDPRHPPGNQKRSAMDQNRAHGRDFYCHGDGGF